MYEKLILMEHRKEILEGQIALLQIGDKIPCSHGDYSIFSAEVVGIDKDFIDVECNIVDRITSEGFTLVFTLRKSDLILTINSSIFGDLNKAIRILSDVETKIK